MRPNYLDIAKITTDKSILRIFKIVQKYGGVLRFVGGAVRDALTGRTDFNLDLSTDLSPDELAEACEEAGIKTVPVGLKADTLGVLINNRLLTISSLETDNWEDDAARRDLTINAVYADEHGNVFDYYDGISDLENGIVRFIGDAGEKIKADYLRILRFFRFYSLFGKGEPDKKAIKAIIDNRNGLKNVSIDRIREELFKILVTPNASTTLKIMFENNIMINWLADSDNLDLLKALNELEIKGKVKPDALRALFMLYLPDKSLAENIAARLKFTRRMRDDFIKLALIEDTLDDFLDPAMRLKIVYKYGKETAISKFLIASAVSTAAPDKVRQIVSDLRNLIVPVLPVSGRDIVKIGITDNSEIGRILDAIEHVWINHNFSLSREELLNLAH